MPPPRPESCPHGDCDGVDCMVKHGHYKRHVILVIGVLVWFGVHRFLCKECGRTVSFLPDFAVPYKHYGP